MRKLIQTLILFVVLQSSFSQSLENCVKKRSIVLSGEYTDYEVEECITNIEITTVGEDTVIKGISFISGIESLKMIPTDNYTIRIKPEIDSDSFEIIDLYAIERADEGNVVLEEKSTISLYPNPADTNLTIETDETILSYTITNTYGILQTQSNIPNSNVISVSSLQTGWYYISLQTNSQIITKTFYKN